MLKFLDAFSYIELGEKTMTKLSEFKSDNRQKKAVTEQDLQQTYEKYKDKSQSELFESLMQQVNLQKANGTFDYAALEQMVNSLQGSLPKENFENIKRIMERLK